MANFIFSIKPESIPLNKSQFNFSEILRYENLLETNNTAFLMGMGDFIKNLNDGWLGIIF
jgi:hypothetical protein